jgi:class 3 adenylate cyclase
MEQPQTQYAKSGDLNIGYQVVGDGPRDIVFVPGLMSHIDLAWSFPVTARFYERLAAFSRLILYDKRGQGVSDPSDGVPTLEEDMEDLRAVLDAVGSTETVLFGYSEGGPMSALFAATHPDRVSALIFMGSFARGFLADGRPWESYEMAFDVIEHWGEGRGLRMFAPTGATDGTIRRFGAFERAVGSPRMVKARFEMACLIDASAVLGTLRQPALVLHAAGDAAVPVRVGRELAEAIPGARYVEIAGGDHIAWLTDAEEILDEIEQFLTGARHHEPDRVLATVLFTDIVDSTRRAWAVGDGRWQTLMSRHDALVRDALARYRGRAVKTMGDGFLATFDGPARGIRCARDITDEVGMLGIDVRAGLHTGECEVTSDDVRGMAVNIAARVNALAGPGEVLVSSTVKDLVVGSGITFTGRGAHELKGVPGEWQLFGVDGAL